MFIELQFAKKYLRIDEDFHDEDELISLMIDNAEIYIENTGVNIKRDNPKQMKQVQLLTLILISDFYENRSLDGTVSEKISYTVKTLITQLKYSFSSSSDSSSGGNL